MVLSGRITKKLHPKKTRPILRTLGLLFLAEASLSLAHAQTRSIPVDLKPKQTQTIPIPLQEGELARVHLHLHGGLVVVSASLAGKNDRPLWRIDLGRDAHLLYIVGGSGKGTYNLQLTSIEQEKLATLSVEIDPSTPADQHSIDLRDAEDALANADLVRSRAKSAIPGLDAARTYDRALTLATRLDNIPLQRLILTQKARLLIFRQNKFEEAHTLLDQAVALPPAGDEPQQALAWKTLATVRYDLGQYLAAIQANANALNLYRTTGDVYWQGIVLGNLSSNYAELGQGDKALTAAKEALNDAEQEHDAAGVVYCLAQVAELSRQQGDLEGALRAFHEAIDFTGRIAYAPLVEAEIQRDLGAFYAQIGDWDQSRLALERCLELESKLNDPVSLDARGILAEVLQHQGHLQEAITQDTAAIDAARALSLKHEEAELLLKRASAELLAQQRSEALTDIDAATQLATALAAIPLQIEAFIAQGNAQTDPDTAAKSYRSALHLAELTGEREQQSAALAGLAHAQQTLATPEQALSSIESALKILEASRGNLGNRDLQVTYFALHRSWYELAVDLCMQLNARHPEKNYTRLAFNYTERARTRSLLDTLYTSGYDASAPTPEPLREAYARNRQAIADQQSLLTHSSESATSEVAAKLQQLYREQETLNSEIQSSDHRLTSLLARQTADIPLLQHQLLDDHSILLSYWLGQTHSYRWTITPTAVLVDTLPSRDQLNRTILPLERLLRARRSTLTPGEDIAAFATHQRAYETSLQTALTRTGATLLSRIPKTTRSIFLISDGSLLSLPFTALRIPSGPTSAYAIRLYTFFNEPSASVAVYLRQHPSPNQPLRIAVFADPIFSRTDPRAPSASDQKLTPLKTQAQLLFANLPRLTGSRTEALEILHLAPPNTVALRTGFDATPAQVSTLTSADASILHFATHTVALPGHPEISGIALSMFTRQGVPQDGIFWLKDIYELHLPLSLVVLSGCTTDNLDNDPGEGLNSVARAFFFSGVHSVIGSLWTVDDKATSRLMQAFYRNLLVDHKRAAEALRAAQLKLLADPQTSSPSAWAPFVIAGWPSAYATQQNERNPTYTTSLAPKSPKLH
jgi:CHAT domain-containing protein